MEVHIRGAGDFAAFAVRLKASSGGLDKDLRRAVTKAARPLQRRVREHVGEYLPSGYAPIIRKSLRLRTQQRGGGVTIRAHAGGKARRREVGRLERGVLKHPVFGRYRYVWRGKSRVQVRNPWVTQPIRPHFFTEPIRSGAGEVRDEIRQAMDEIARRAAG